MGRAPVTAEIPPGHPPHERGPLVVRLRNWVGDVLLGVPMLTRLAAAGHGLHLVGKGWAVDLLAGHGWPVHVLPATLGERVRLLRQLRAQVRGGERSSGPSDVRRSERGSERSGGRRPGIDALCLPYSFSSALEFRLAGLRALGHAHEGRRLLLARAVPRARDRHELAVTWQLGDALLGEPAPLPPRIGLNVAPAHHDAAAALCERHGIAPGFIVVCPFAGGTFDKLDKSWPAFADFVRDDLAPLARAAGRHLLVCPGPGEEALARAAFASAQCLEGVRLGVYAALLADAALMISNDTGPGHLAAAVGTPLVSVLGPTDAARWGAWGPSVLTLGGRGTWPTRADVLAAVQARLAAARSAIR